MIHVLVGIAGVAFALFAWASFELGGEVLRGRADVTGGVNAYRIAGLICLALCGLCWRFA
jgi:hypothetical protein